ncbi:hypothetical protein DA075_12250 [Methylobacterium currus]|uniref:Uncharacterized protein n=1 Tax=Methylobacterium currus TaxID=2051553 RepID=A0A2R4WJ71_9HYPH|nr:hypothetical protein [Methylobacterium currus]AWB21592.1 hypothetical protein DA075_12250 [Methylobacterium currus]
MDMIVILAAVAALVFAGLVLVFAQGRARNPPLRLPHEQELEDRGDELFRDFDQDLAGMLDEAARHPAALPVAPERLEAPDAERFRTRGGMTIDHDPAEPGLLREPGDRTVDPSKSDLSKSDLSKSDLSKSDPSRSDPFRSASSKFDSSKRDGESR